MRVMRLLLALALVALPAVAHADADAVPVQNPSRDPQVVRLLDAKRTLNWNLERGANKDRYGHAEALIEAPAEQVAKTATEFGKYRDLHRKFKAARVIAKEGDKTDVYMRYPVQIGPMTIELYAVMRFNPTRNVGGTYIIEAFGVKGDMKRGHTLITIKPVDARHAIMEVDVLLVPVLPAPQSYIDEELRDGAQDFINGIRDRAQPRPGPVASL